MIEKGEELWLMLIIHIISKRNDSVNILFCTLHDQLSFLIIDCFIYLFIYLFIRVSKYSAVSSKIKKSVNDWRKLFKFIPLASIFTSYLSKGQFRLLSLKNSELRHLATFLHKVTRS